MAVCTFAGKFGSGQCSNFPLEAVAIGLVFVALAYIYWQQPEISP